MRSRPSESEVAIKLVSRDQYGVEHRAHKYFNREVETLKIGYTLSSNIVKLLGSVANHVCLAIVTEYCDKGDMSHWMDFELSVNWDGAERALATVLEAYFQLANGLIALHKRRIAHRDLKGSNVLITSRSARYVRGSLAWFSAAAPGGIPYHSARPATPFAVKIGDFGLARFLDSSGELTSGVGTEGYMAPEVRSGSAYGTESDLYSLGVMLKRDLERCYGDQMGHVRGCNELYQAVKSLTSANPEKRAPLEALLSALMNCNNIHME